MPRASRLAPLLGLCLCATLQAQTPLRAAFVTALNEVTDLATPRDDERRMFALTRLGTVRVIKDGVLLATPFLDIQAKVTSAVSEQGLLGLAFHPDYRNTGYFYLDYTRLSDGATVLERYSVSANPDVADPNSAFTVLVQAQPTANHNGGALEFGPDGYLYAAIGEARLGCPAMAPDTLLGKIIRIDVDGGSPYAIPPSNPFVGVANYRPEIWALGLRNPWRMSFDRLTGDLYVADVGWVNREEINIQPASSAGGENYGWPIYEGNQCINLGPCGSCGTSYTAPALDYVYSGGGGNCCVIGGVVYRGCAIPDLKGTYFYGDHCGGIFSFRWANQTVTELRVRNGDLGVTGALRVTTFGEDACGEIWFAGRSGAVYKIVPAVAPPATSLGFAKRGSNGREPRLSVCGLLTSGLSAELRLRDALPNAAGAVWLGLSANPTPFLGGTIVPIPPIGTLAIALDPKGLFTLTAAGGGGPLDFYMQAVVLDAGASNGFALSNALKVTVGA